jgi:hypothetical protein
MPSSQARDSVTPALVGGDGRVEPAMVFQVSLPTATQTSQARERISDQVR